MRTLICFTLLIISISYANEQEDAVEHNNTRVSVYLHPASLLFFSNTIDVTAVYSTVEVPFSLSNSFTIRPSLLGARKGIFRLGSDFGLRYYLTGKGEGLYLQGQMGIFYYRRNIYTGPTFFNSDDDCDADCNENDHELVSNPLWFDFMGYIGHSLKFSHVSVFIDVGIGVLMGFPGWPDFNIGIGIPFGAPKPVNAQEDAQEKLEPKQDNTRVSIYLHPLFFLLGISETENPAYAIYSTIEIPFNLKRALIIKPSFVKEPREERGLDDERFKQLKVGSDIGMRIYKYRKGEGFYWQMQTGIFYYDGHHLFPETIPPARNSIWLDIMAYSGYSLKFSNVSIFADIGIGFGGLYGNLYALSCNSKCFSFFPIVDANFGIGIPF
ncbi:MAG: hypothetical protein LBC87_05405 [Fibromonadaceae bacterium]|jgi:hypothetical protein|nr:hypothetical protein [Fibromonadaceae bacterium]